MKEKPIAIIVGLEGQLMGVVSIAPEGVKEIAQRLFGEDASKDDPRQEHSILLMLADAAADGFAKGKGGSGARRAVLELPSGEGAGWVEAEMSEKGLEGAHKALGEVAGAAWIRSQSFEEWSAEKAIDFAKRTWTPAKPIKIVRS